MAKFNITVVRPEGYIHSECFREVGEGLQAGLVRLGHTASFGENTVLPHAVNIILGMHLLDEATAMSLNPLTTVVYSLEQLGDPAHMALHGYTNGSWTPPWYLQLAQRYQIWDYSPINLRLWRSVQRAWEPQIVEVGYVPELTRFQSHREQPIDVFFYGWLNDRRQDILARLKNAGLEVVCGAGVYGAERDAVLASTKLVLNLHAYPLEIFEVVRVSYLLANSKAVVSETSPDIGSLREAVALADADTIVDVCRDLLADDEKRHALERRGFEVFSRHSLLPSLQVAISPFI